MKYALIGSGRITTNHVRIMLNNGLETEGKISYYNSNRGFGYIDVGTSEDIFLHICQYHNSTDGEPRVGDMLCFDIVDSERRLQAINITK